MKCELEKKVKNVMFLDALLVRWHSDNVRRMEGKNRITDSSFIYVVPICDHLSAVK